MSRDPEFTGASSPEDHLAPSLSRRARRWAGWGLLALTLALIVRFFVRNREQSRFLLEIDAREILLLIVLSVAYLVAQAERYRVVLAKCGGRKIGFRDWFQLFVLGRFLNTVLPQAGNLYRAARLKRDHGISYTRYVGGFFSFAWLDTCLNLFISAAVIIVVAPELRIAGLPAAAAVAALAAAAILGPVALERLAAVLPLPSGALSWLRNKVGEMLRLTLDSLRDGVYLLQVTVLGLVVFGLGCLLLERSFASLGVELGAAEIVCFYVLLKLSTHFNLTPGNAGVLELGFGLLGQQMALGLGAGVLASAVLRVVAYVALTALALPMGGLRLLRQSRRGRKGGRRRADHEAPGALAAEQVRPEPEGTLARLA